MANVLQFRKHETFYLNGKSHRCYKGVRNKFLTELEKLTTTHNYNESTPINDRSWIDTKFIPNKNNDIDIKITFSIPESSATKRTIVLGSWMDNAYGSIGIETDQSRKIRLYIDGGNIDHRTAEIYPTETPILAHYHYDATTPLHTFTAQTLDGSVSSELNISKKNWSLWNQLYSMIMGKDRRPLAAYLSSFGGVTIYQVEITNGNKHLKFVPYITRSNKVAMYDVINQEWHYNEGNVDLIAGRQIKEVESIDIPLSAYFDTLFKPNTTTTSIRMRFTPLYLTNGAWMFGSRNNETIDNTTCCVYQTNSGYRLDWANGYQDNHTYTCSVIPSLDEPINLEMTRGYAKLNDEVFTFTENTSVDIDYTFLIGAARMGPRFGAGTSFKLNFCELFNTTTKEDYRYFIPAKDENGAGFLFDKVTHIAFLPIDGTITTIGPEIHYIDYLESTGTQYIDTDLVRTITDVWKFKGNFSYSDVNTRQLNGAQGYTYIGVAAGYYQICNSNDEHINVIAVKDQFAPFEVEFNCPNNKVSYSLCGTSVSNANSANAYQNWPDGAHMCVFSLNTGVIPSSCKIAYFQFYKNNELVRDYIPSMNENLEGMMLDKVWHNLYTNVGTGNFVIGNQIIRE